MKVLSVDKDGGPDSTVFGLFFIELKKLFSIVLLCFENGTREVYHNHAFNCFSCVVKGQLKEWHLDGKMEIHSASWKPFVTRRNTFHKVVSEGRTWVITFRGPWLDYWEEWLPKEQKFIKLTHGRKVYKEGTNHRG